MSRAEAVALGFLQGVTEFLPVSSSGHLVIGKALLNVQESGIAFEVFVHLGTLMSILAVFHRDTGLLATAAGQVLRRPLQFRLLYIDDPAVRFIALVGLGTIPAAMAGLVVGDLLDPAFSSVRLVSGMLMVTAASLFMSRWARERGVAIGVKVALIVGLAQAVAILPGISRAGVTVSAALLLGVARDEAVRYSLFLAVPVIAGAALLQTAELIASSVPQVPWGSLAAGTVAAFAVGCIAILVLRKVVTRGRLSLFAYYCASLAVFAWIVAE